MLLERSPNAKGWQPITQEEVRRWRRDLPEGHVREFNTAHTVGLEEAEGDGDSAVLESHGPPVIDDARAVVNDLRNIAIQWATANRENARVAVKMMRAANPGAFAHRSDEELTAMILEHLEQEIQSVVEGVYRDPQNKWDKGKLVDIKDGVWRP